MTDDEHTSVLEFQQREIDHCRDDLRDIRRFLRRFIDSTTTVGRGTNETYLRGLHDGVGFSADAVEGITHYDNHDALYDPRRIADDPLSNALQTVVTEAGNENWGNVRANLKAALDAATALDEGAGGGINCVLCDEVSETTEEHTEHMEEVHEC